MSESLTPICIIEAASFSGKTTLAKLLQEKHGIRIVQEYARYADSAKKFPPLPFATYQDAKDSTKFFVELEIDRSRKALKLHEKTKKPVLMDRSLLGCLAFQKSIEILHPNQNSAYQYALELAEMAYNRNEILTPVSTIYLSPPTQDQFRRRIEKRGKTDNELLNVWESGETMKYWYLKCLENCFNKGNSLILPSSDENPEGNIQPTMDFLLNPNSYQNTFLQSLQSLRNL
jgi:deoxyadenosine/deoxycytidine kinase